MFRYAKNVRLSLSGSLWLPLWLPLAPSGSYWISPCLSLALYGSLWLPLWLSLALTATLWHTLALSGSLLLSNFAYTALDRLSGPLLGFQRRCHADTLSPALLKRYIDLRRLFDDWCYINLRWSCFVGEVEEPALLLRSKDSVVARTLRKVFMSAVMLMIVMKI